METATREEIDFTLLVDGYGLDREQYVWICLPSGEFAKLLHMPFNLLSPLILTESGEWKRYMVSSAAIRQELLNAEASGDHRPDMPFLDRIARLQGF
jgi:hypothetical protein